MNPRTLVLQAHYLACPNPAGSAPRYALPRSITCLYPTQSINVALGLPEPSQFLIARGMALLH